MQSVTDTPDLTIQVPDCHILGGLLSAGFSPPRPGFAPRSVYVGPVVEKVELGQVSSQLLFSAVSVTALMLQFARLGDGQRAR
jgi:hypothetical protein